MGVYTQGGAFRRPGTFYLDVDQSDFSADTTIRQFPFVAANGQRFLIIARATTTDDWKIINVDTMAYATKAVPTETVTITAQALHELQFAQNNDYVFFAHESVQPFAVYYDGNTFFINYVPSAFPGPFLADITRHAFLDPEQLNNNGRGSLTSSTGTGVGTLTSSAGFFVPGHVGAFFKLTAAGNTGFVIATSYVSATVLNVTAVGAPTTPVGIAAGTNWEEEAWSNARGWPRSVCMYQQRLVFGGTRSDPSSIWASQRGDVKEFMYRPFEQDAAFANFTNDDSRAFSFTVAAERVNKIQWLSPGRTLVIGTEGQEYVAVSETAFGPVNLPGLQPQTSYGCAYTQPLRKDSLLYFVQRSGQMIRDFQFNNVQDVYKSDNVTFLCEHMIFNSYTQREVFTTPVKIKTVVLQPSLEILWVLDSNGDFFGITINKDAKIQAGHRHYMGGLLGDDRPKVESICYMPSGVSGDDELYVAVRRTINGSPVLSLERMVPDYRGSNPHDTNTPMLYLDCAAIGVGVGPTNTFTGFSHLEGQIVSVLADGKDVGDFTVSGGAVVLPRNYTDMVAGLKYRSRLVTINAETGSPIGTAQGLDKRIDRAMIRFFRTAVAKFGRKTQAVLDTVTFRNFSAPGNPITPTSDDKVVPFPAGYDKKGQIAIETDRPFPMAVTSVTLRGITYD